MSNTDSISGSFVSFTYREKGLRLYFMRKNPDDESENEYFSSQPKKVTVFFDQDRAVRANLEVAFDHATYQLVELYGLFGITPQTKSNPVDQSVFDRNIAIQVTLALDPALLEDHRDSLEEDQEQGIAQFAERVVDFHEESPFRRCDVYTFKRVKQQMADGTEIGFDLRGGIAM